MKKFVRHHLIEILVMFFSLSYSWWLMFSTFSYKNGSMHIATKAWSDFASHIPLIRSFSLGYNFPPQYPQFANEPIHYHFLFYFFVGILEKIGIRIDFSLNLLSILGFAGLLLAIYYFAKLIFSSRIVGILSVLFFLLNGSLSFVYFFSTHSFSKNSLLEIITNTKFPSFAPYDSGIVSAFWNMNIYTNQRHFAPALAFSLFLIFIFLHHIYKERKEHYYCSVLIGLALGLSFFLHMAIFVMTSAVIFFLTLFFKKLRISGIIVLCIAVIGALPQYYYLTLGSSSSFKLSLVPGYLISGNFTVANFFWYWFNNLGLHLILIPIGFLLSSKTNKRILIAFFSLFMIGNTFQFSPEMAANHKFFNYFLIVGGMYSAYALTIFWKKILLRPVVGILVIFLVASGIIDFFPIYNDVKIGLEDYPKNQDMTWIIKNTPPSSIILNTNYLYTVPSLAGRRIFLGWPYFSWSQGYDTTSRSNQIKSFFALNDTSQICTFLKENKLDYIYLETPSEDFPFDESFWKQLPYEYRNTHTNTVVINTKKLCTY